MDSSAGFCQRRSPSLDRFLGLFSFSPPSPFSAVNEAEVFWTTTTNADDFTDPEDDTAAAATSHRPLKNSGILAVLPDSDFPAQVIYRKPSLSSPSKPIPSIPRPSQQSQPSSDGVQTQSAPSRRFQQHSAPMKVPVLSKAMMMERRRNYHLDDVADGDDDVGGEEEEMVPPHELVARGSGVSAARTTFSVLEGVGRTLKGRDLRQVRNAIWRKTGFLD